MMPEKERIYQEIYLKNIKRLYSYIFRKTGDRADTEDILQEVFIVLLFKLDQFLADYPNNDKLITGFLFGITSNKLRRYWRDHRNILDMEISMELLPNLSDPRSGFGDNELSLPRWLSPQDKKLLLLKHKGYSLKEIADQLGISHGACRMQSVRLTERLKKYFENF